MSSVIAHHNEKIFPDSYSFIPERWTDQPDGGRSLERYIVSFSKGSRQCIGQKCVLSLICIAPTNDCTASQRQRFFLRWQRSSVDTIWSSLTRSSNVMWSWSMTCFSHNPVIKAEGWESCLSEVYLAKVLVSSFLHASWRSFEDIIRGGRKVSFRCKYP